MVYHLCVSHYYNLGRGWLRRPLPPANACSVHSLPTVPSVLFRLGFALQGLLRLDRLRLVPRLVRLRLLATRLPCPASSSAWALTLQGILRLVRLLRLYVD